jgi:hypothetical protein
VLNLDDSNFKVGDINSDNLSKQPRNISLHIENNRLFNTKIKIYKVKSTNLSETNDQSVVASNKQLIPYCLFCKLPVKDLQPSWPCTDVSYPCIDMGA